MKQFFTFFLLIVTVAASADVLYFRSGTITAAEVTTREIAIKNLDTVTFNSLPGQKAYAILSADIVPSRKISIFDYSLVADGMSYPCVALSTGKQFICSDQVFSGKNVKQLLFIVNAANLSRVKNFTLHCNLAPANGTYDLIVPFTNIGSRMPTAPEKIPATGLLEKTAK